MALALVIFILSCCYFWVRSAILFSVSLSSLRSRSIIDLRTISSWLGSLRMSLFWRLCIVWNFCSLIRRRLEIAYRSVLAVAVSVIA